MKKKHYISLAVVVVGLAFCAVLLFHPRQLPLSECSQVYQKYKDVEGVDASFLKAFPVDDTFRVDVTLLQATDSAGWETLQKEFNLVAVPPEIMATFDTNSIFTKYVPQRDHSQPMDSIILNNDILAYSYHRKEMTLFHLTTEQQAVAIMEYNAKETSKKTPLIF